MTSTKELDDLDGLATASAGPGPKQLLVEWALTQLDDGDHPRMVVALGNKHAAHAKVAAAFTRRGISVSTDAVRRYRQRALGWESSR